MQKKTLRYEPVISLIKSNKYPLIIALGFFSILFYVSFFDHHYWYEDVGIFYLYAGEQILHGDGKDVYLPDAPIGGPVLFASLNYFFHNGFFIEKMISVLSGTGIVLLSYFIIKNIFNSKLALLGQLFFAVNPQLVRLSIWAKNDILPIFLISLSLYFITKKNLKSSDMIVIGFLLGISSMIRYQAIPVFFALLIFTLIRDKKIRINLSCMMLMSICFLVAMSPLIIYNYATHGVIMENGVNFYSLLKAKFQTDQYRNDLMQENANSLGIFHNFDLFLKNYSYNLFYHNSDILFNFNTLGSVSIIPIVPFLGAIPVIGGLIYSLKMKLNKTNVVVLLATATITTFSVLILGDIHIHFFAIVIIPLLFLGILHIRNIKKNLLPLLILAVIYFLIMSIIPLYMGYQLFPMWILIPILSAIFFTEVIPKIYYKIKKSMSDKVNESNILNNKLIPLLLVSLVLLINLGFSYRLLEAELYDDYSYSGVINEFYKLFQKKDSLQEFGIDYKQIGEILSRQPEIKNSYIMAPSLSYAYYAHSKFVFVNYLVPVKNGTLNDFIARENWTPWEYYYSNLASFPIDKRDVYKPLPDYFIYQPVEPYLIKAWGTNITQTYIPILSDPNNPHIPSNWKVLYQSNKTGTIVYKINHSKELW